MTKKEVSSGSQQLKKDLKEKSLARCYVICGEEDYLCRYYYDQLCRQVLDGLTADFNYHRLTSENFSLQLLSESLEALPMMAERSLVRLDDVDIFCLGEADSAQLSAMLEDIPPYCCLVLTCSDFKPDKRKKLWKTLEKVAVIAEFSFQNETELRPWIVRHFRALGKQISSELCSYLLSQCGSSMTRLHGEIEKISSYSAAETIVRADIDAVVEPTVDAVVFQITDALSNRSFDIAMERLNAVFKMQEEPIPVVALIGAQMRRLRAAKILQNADELAAICGISPRAAGMALTQARRFSEKFCDKAVLLCRDADYKLKTSYDEPQRVVQMLLLELAQEADYD